MAIDPKELRIGSHVDVTGFRVRVGGVYKESIVVYTTDDAECENHVIDLNRISSIPITPDLLKELKFEYRDNGYWEHWFLGGFDLEKNKNSKYFDYDRMIRLEYLHELENLYYMIYGKELIND